MTDGAARKKKIRGGHKASATQMLSQIDALLREESSDLQTTTAEVKPPRKVRNSQITGRGNA